MSQRMETVENFAKVVLVLLLIWGAFLALGHQIDNDAKPKPTPTATARR